jgi:hypothetical protein
MVQPLTLSSRSPNTAALDKMALSMKLSIYVQNSSGMSTRSIFLSTLRAAVVEGPWPSSESPSILLHCGLVW